MQLVLDDQVRPRQRSSERSPHASVHVAIKTTAIMAVHMTQQGACAPLPRQCGELVHRGDEKRRQPAIDRFVHREDGQVPLLAGKLAEPVLAADHQIVRLGLIG